jgi:biotin synthase
MTDVETIGAAVDRFLAGERTLALTALVLKSSGDAQERLCRAACASRDAHFPARTVEVRSVLEVSNVCRQRCRYCSMWEAEGSPRYTLAGEAIAAIADGVYARGRRVLMLQSGENPSPAFVSHMAAAVSRVKAAHADLRLILCLGSLSLEQFRELRQAGAERYILKFESSSPELYHSVKPSDTLGHRLAAMEAALESGFLLGSGSIVGLPQQRLEDVAADLLCTTRWRLGMVSASVFVPGERSGFAAEPPGDVNLTLNAMAILRLLNPDCLIPSTSSLDRIEPGAQLRGLRAGANTVTIHDGTPDELKAAFPIYSSQRIMPREVYLRELVQRAGLQWAEEALK